ncbi:MAG: methyltransferase [Patescibacteria group bacterium]
MPSYQNYLDAEDEILQESQREKKPYKMNILGKKFIVHPNVFSPKYFRGTPIFSEHLPITVGDEFLEIGPGTGVTSIIALYRGAKRVTAIDINPSAVENMKANIALHHLEDRAEVRYGDVYSSLKPDERFDIIFWNTPFGLVPEGTPINDLQKSIFDPGYQATERFFIEAKDHLKNNGKLYIGFSSTLGRLDIIKRFSDKAGFMLEKIFETDSEEIYPVKFEIFSAKRNGKSSNLTH